MGVFPERSTFVRTKPCRHRSHPLSVGSADTFPRKGERKHGAQQKAYFPGPFLKYLKKSLSGDSTMVVSPWPSAAS